MEFAKVELRMGAEQSTGGSLRSHLETVWQQTGVKPAELEECECPDAARHIWGWFIELSRSRGSSGMGGPSPISYMEITAWSHLTKSEPTPFEISCIMGLDSIWLNSSSKRE